MKFIRIGDQLLNLDLVTAVQYFPPHEQQLEPQCAITFVERPEEGSDGWMFEGSEADRLWEFFKGVVIHDL